MFMTIAILDIVHRPVTYLKHDISETGFCVRLQVEASKLGLIERDSLCVRTPTKSKSKLLYD
jgi:hypothetical protein